MMSPLWHSGAKAADGTPRDAELVSGRNELWPNLTQLHGDEMGYAALPSV
jgi:hypothetical protein